MLKPEKKLVEKLRKEYGDDLKPPRQFVHHMMDMKFAYSRHKEQPYYDFFREQLDKMDTLQREHPCEVFGFSAFDPRRPYEEWEKIRDASIAKGFKGFKFYPPMGYLPSGDRIPEVRESIEKFLDFCVEKDFPIFTHCDPLGFEARKGWGVNAHPKHWIPVLDNKRWSCLRLCFGHAGGPCMTNGKLVSRGWMAEDDADWESDDNFARIVTDLCKTYENVYCDTGFITDLLDAGRPELFERNLGRARKVKGKYELLKKMAFGSDWHMPFMLTKTRRYLDIFIRIFNDAERVEFIDDFFYLNAYSYMKLPH